MSFSKWLYRYDDRTHDYDPEWDYEPHESPNKDMKGIVEKTVLEMREKLLPQLRLFKNFTVFYAAPHSLGGKLGRYSNGTVSEPVIVLDTEAIRGACEKYDLPVELGVETTIAHELAHAIQEAEGLEDDEEQAEEFARQWHYNRTVTKLS